MDKGRMISIVIDVSIYMSLGVSLSMCKRVSGSR